MAYIIQPKAITLSGNVLLVKPLSRGAAKKFRDDMASAGEDSDRQEQIGLDLVAANVTFEDGSALDVDEVPSADIVALLKTLCGVDGAGVADFTPRP